MRKFVTTLAATALLALPTLAQAQVKIQIQIAPNAKAAQIQKAQGFVAIGIGGGKANLLQNKDVQKDLDISEEQAAKIGDIAKNQQNLFKNLPRDRAERAKKIKEFNETQDKAIAGVLKPAQFKRLEQIETQRMGLRNPKVAEKLNLTDEQQKKMVEIQKESFQELRKIRAGGQVKPEDIRKKYAEIQSNVQKKIADGVLTPEQKAKWKEMTGAPFKGNLNQGGFRGVPIRGVLPVQPNVKNKAKPRIQ